MLIVNTAGKSGADAIRIIREELEKNTGEKGEKNGKDGNRIKVLIENPTLASDIKKFLEARGFSVMPEDDDGRLSLTGTKNVQVLKAPIAEPQAASSTSTNNVPNQKTQLKSTMAVLITGKNFSRENKKYGHVFLRRVIMSFLKTKVRPDFIALMNEGVKLALYNTSSCDFLKELEAKGTRIMVSGMCADHFGITESIGAGVISEMVEMLDAVSGCDKIINL